MQVSTIFQPTAHTQGLLKPFLLRMLAHPQYEAGGLPAITQSIHVYVDGRSRAVMSGLWEMGSGVVYMAGSSGSLSDGLTRLALLTGVVATVELNQDPEIMAGIQAALTREITTTAVSIWGNLVRSVTKPEQIAINPDNAVVAAKMDGIWVAPNGQPVEVGARWIVMDV